MKQDNRKSMNVNILIIPFEYESWPATVIERASAHYWAAKPWRTEERESNHNEATHERSSNRWNYLPFEVTLISFPEVILKTLRIREWYGRYKTDFIDHRLNNMFRSYFSGKLLENTVPVFGASLFPGPHESAYFVKSKVFPNVKSVFFCEWVFLRKERENVFQGKKWVCFLKDLKVFKKWI